jgi:hypothetical protein
MNGIPLRVMIYVFGFFALMTTSLAIAATPAEDTLTWHSSVKKGAVFGWKLTSLSPETPGTPFNLGGQTLTIDDPIYFKYTKNPPTDPTDVLGSSVAPDFIDLYVKETKVSWDDVSQERVILLGLIVPIRYAFDNGTILDVIEMAKLGRPPGYNMSITDRDTHVDVSYNSTIIKSSYKITKSTGVTSELALTIEYFYGSVTWEYDSSLKLPEEEEDSGIPGFEVLPLFAALSLLVALAHKKHRK